VKRKDKSLVVVLGMHRSGTSAITRGLTVLGVELGDELMPPAPDNETGFFEDREINALNVELLRSLGHDWHSLAPITSVEWKSAAIKPLQERAMQVMRIKMRDRKSFGLKDPRLARLLPFWKSVFQKLDLVPRYVIAVRNPLSVAKSLESRNQISTEKSCYLWLEHVVSSILETRGSKRLVVDYDRLLDKPQEELERIAKTLHLTAVSAESLGEYRDQYLDKGLRHSRFHPKDLTKDPAVSPEVKEAFRLLSEMAAGRLLPDSANVQRAFKRYQEFLTFAAPAFGWVDKQEGHVTALEHKISESNSRVAFLEGVLAQRSSDLEAARNSASAYAQELNALEGELEAARLGKDRVELALEEKSRLVEQLTENAAELATQFENLGSEIRSYEHNIAASRDALEHVKSELALKSTNLDVLHGENSSLRTQLESALAELAKRESALESAKRSHEKQKAALEERSRNVDDLNDRIVQLANSLNEANTAIGAYEQDKAAARKQFARLEGDLEQMRTELANRELALRDKSQRIDQLNTDLAGLTTSRDAALAQLQSREEETTSRLAAISDENRFLQTQLQSALASAASLESKAQEEHQLIDQLREEVDTLRRAVENNAQEVLGVASSLESAVERRMLRGGL